MAGLGSMRSGRDLLLIFATSIVVWLMETVKYWFVMHAFTFSVSFLALMLINGIVNLATTLPSAPGYIGTFDTPAIETLVAYGIDAPVGRQLYPHSACGTVGAGDAARRILFLARATPLERLHQGRETGGPGSSERSGHDRMKAGNHVDMITVDFSGTNVTAQTGTGARTDVSRQH